MKDFPHVLSHVYTADWEIFIKESVIPMERVFLSVLCAKVWFL